MLEHETLGVIAAHTQISYCQTTQPRYILCGDDLNRAAAAVCQPRGYDLNYDWTQANNCCTQGCTYLALSVFCNPRETPNPNQPRFIFCGTAFYTALDSLCVSSYDITRASNVAPQCCSPGCTLSTLIPVCNRPLIL
ncbi:uncharacterized protein LOC117179535 isoform X3 [Belonocnema kinseyi]|uniref:uncharacterized protein LOC117179535 isoform X3 n=1 Tax=Belonocnema kinseyi TaxID=2817044 RepID=UPI00143D3A19|nr:uncharacterized protein LOC117179535 isoform X3 [Belonocnema kinseyi]